MTGRVTPKGFSRVPLQALRFHPRNIRSNLGDLTELAASIRAEGVLVPLMAQRTSAGGLQLLHGHRRWAAADMAGLKTVPVIVIEQTLRDDEAMLLMLAEDKKEAVSAADRARALQQLHDEFDYDWSTIAERLGVSDDELHAWRKGKPASGGLQAVRTRALPPPRRRAPRKPSPRLSPKRLHTLLSEWEGRAPVELLAQLQEMLGNWQPVERPQDVVLPDLDDVDEVEVEQLLSGARPLAKATTGAVAVAVDRLTTSGATATEIAVRLACTDRTVTRYRAALAERKVS